MSDDTQDAIPEIHDLYDIAGSRINELRLSLVAKRQKYFFICQILKKHQVGYLDFQKEAYGLKQEIDAIVKELAEIQVQYVTAKRQYEREHNMNQVKRLIPGPQKGTMKLVD